MVEIIMLGVVIILLVALLIGRFGKTSHRKELENSVILKKLQLSEKVLISQLDGTPDIVELIKHGSMVTKLKEEEDNASQPIGYARENRKKEN